jgi:hypothetical protein
VNASPGAPPAPSPPPPLIEPREPPRVIVPAPDPTARRHDGFYLRLGLGIAHVRGSAEPAGPAGPPFVDDVDFRGTGVASELSLGGTVAEGLVIGGGFFLTAVDHVTWRGSSVRRWDPAGGNAFEGGNGSFGMLGLLADWYPQDRGGFHVQGALGFGALTFEPDQSDWVDVPDEEWTGGGGGLMLGAGYEFWVAKQWSLGGVVRAVMMSGKLENDEDDTEVNVQAFVPALLFVATHH